MILFSKVLLGALQINSILIIIRLFGRISPTTRPDSRIPENRPDSQITGYELDTWFDPFHNQFTQIAFHSTNFILETKKMDWKKVIFRRRNRIGAKFSCFFLPFSLNIDDTNQVLALTDDGPSHVFRVPDEQQVPLLYNIISRIGQVRNLHAVIYRLSNIGNKDRKTHKNKKFIVLNWKLC